MSVAPLSKRCEITRTSSGCETSGGGVAIVLILYSWRLKFGPLPTVLPAVLVEHLVHFVFCHIKVKVVIHLYCRRPTAGANAFHFFQGENSVWRRLFVFNLQFVLAMLQQLFSS